MGPDLENFPQSPACQNLLHLDDGRRETPTVPNLKQAVRPIDRGDDTRGVGRPPAGRLFTKHGLSRFKRLDGKIRHSVAFGMHKHRMDIGIRQDLVLASGLQPKRIDKRPQKRTFVMGTQQAHPRHSLKRLYPAGCVGVRNSQASDSSTASSPIA
nr:hypothetical protein [Mesorhizobium ventifaucium]